MADDIINQNEENQENQKETEEMAQEESFAEFQNSAS